MDILPKHEIDYKSIKEDARKIGLAILGVGVAGLIIEYDKITSTEGWFLMTVGAIIWTYGVLQPKGG